MEDEWLTFGIVRLREAFEESGHTVLAMDCNVMAASVWIRYGGKTLYEYLSGDVSDDEDHMILRAPGTLFDGRASSGLERWEFWKGRAVEIRNVVSRDIQPVAVAITKRMVDIEEGRWMG
jgi:hypothetical protein